MAGKNTIIAHPQRLEIEKALIDGVPLRTIADQYGPSKSSLIRYRDKHLAERIAKAAELKEQEGLPAVAQAEAQQVIDSQSLLVQLQTAVDRIKKLSNACDKWLTDPDNPEEYTLEPRAEEIKVIYGEQVGDDWIKRKAPLSELIGKLEEDKGVRVATLEHKHADPRELVLKTQNSMKGVAEIILKSIGALKEGTTVFNIYDVQQQVIAVLGEALTPEGDEVRYRVLGKMSKIEEAKNDAD